MLLRRGETVDVSPGRRTGGAAQTAASDTGDVAGTWQGKGHVKTAISAGWTCAAMAAGANLHIIWLHYVSFGV